MQRTSFDKSLTQILTLMVFLAVMVGVSALAVNRYLAWAHGDIIETSLPALEAANGIDLATQTINARLHDLVRAETQPELDHIAETLQDALGALNQRTAELSRAVIDHDISVEGRRISQLVHEVAGQQAVILQRTLDVTKSLAAFEQTGARLNQIISAELELARLKVTADVVDLYAGEVANPKPTLDRLADRHFFAFERLTEMLRDVDAVRLNAQRIPSLTSEAAIESAQKEVMQAMKSVKRRETYLPTFRARQEVRQLVQVLNQIVGNAGIFDQQRLLTAEHALLMQADRALARNVAVLSKGVARVRADIQSASLLRVEINETISNRLFLMLSGLVVAASATGAFLWVRARTRLVERLANVAHQIFNVAQGDYDTAIPITGVDEIGHLEEALNVLREKALEARHLRNRLEDEVIARTGDVVAQMKESDTARSEAERANTAKSEFLARMSHEIRTPLAGVIGMLDLLRLEQTDPARRVRVETALSSARELLEIANDILDYSSSDIPQNRGRPVHFDLRKLVGQLGHHLTSLIGDRDLKGQVDLVEPAPQFLFGDIVKIRQIVGNLLSNAVKYTEEGNVTLTVEAAIDSQTGHPVLSFTVSDTGIGMTQDAVANAFDAYNRAERVRRAGTTGVGLGLAISSNLTKALGGALDVESAPGVGSRFTLTLPLAFGDAQKIDTAEAEAAPSELGKSVLIVDDQPTNRMVARGYLKRLGCDVLEAGDGPEALDLVRRHDVNLALVDFDLPGMSGPELARRIAVDSADTQLVLLTAHRIENTAANCAQYGVSSILTKPISPRLLSDLLHKDSAQQGEDMSDTHDGLQQDIRDLGHNTTAEIVQAFLSGLDEALTQIRESDANNRSRHAHRLKGAAANFHLTRFCVYLERIEKASAEDSLPLIDRLEAEATLAARQLRSASDALDLSID